jgi:hypothetical protein
MVATGAAAFKDSVGSGADSGAAADSGAGADSSGIILPSFDNVPETRKGMTLVVP